MFNEEPLLKETKNKLSRRDFLKLGGIAAATGVGGGFVGARAAEQGQVQPKPEYYKSWDEVEGQFEPGEKSVFIRF